MPFALCAMGLLTFVFSGCRKSEEKEALPPQSPESYMKDPAFLKGLEEKRHELSAIIAERKPLADRMQALVREHGEDLAALQKISEWTNLHAKVTALNAKYQEVRKRQLQFAGNRIAAPKGEGGGGASGGSGKTTGRGVSK